MNKGTQMTLKELKQIIKNLPDDAILCCQSDVEGNEQSVCLDVFVDKAGLKHNYDMKDGNVLSYLGGEDITGIDMQKDNGKILIIFQPSL